MGWGVKEQNTLPWHTCGREGYYIVQGPLLDIYHLCR